MVHRDTTTGQCSSRLDTKSLCFTLLPKVRQLGTCQKSNLYRLSFWEITPLVVQHFEVRHWVATLYQLADGSTVLKLGLDGILDGISRVSTYHGSHIGHQFLVVGFTFPSLGDGSSIVPMVMWIKNCAMAAFVL